MLRISSAYNDVLGRISDEDASIVIRKLVKISSQCYKREEGNCCLAIRDILEGWGIRAELQPVDKPSYRRYNVISTLRGSERKPRLLFNCHVDTVPTEGMTFDPLGGVVKHGRVYGRGASDDKSGIAAGMIALKVLSGAGFPLKGDFVFAAVSDENGQALGVKTMLRRGLSADWGIVAEPTANRVVIAHRGRVDLVVTVKGEAGHSGAPGSGLNAIVKMATLIGTIEKELPRYLSRKRFRRMPELRPSFNVSVIQGGLVQNIIPGECKVIIDRRIIPGETHKEALDEVKEVVRRAKEKDRDLRAEVEVFERPDQFPTCAEHTPIKLMPPYEGKKMPLDLEPDARIAKVARGACEAVLRKDYGFSMYPGHTAAEVLTYAGGIPSIVLGPGEPRKSFAPDESVKIRDVAQGARIVALIAMGLLS
jgi:acetylornithine deacetylase/succinyl-diaminopimelate desuccinylase family protein